MFINQINNVAFTDLIAIVKRGIKRLDDKMAAVPQVGRQLDRIHRANPPSFPVAVDEQVFVSQRMFQKDGFAVPKR